MTFILFLISSLMISSMRVTSGYSYSKIFRTSKFLFSPPHLDSFYSSSLSHVRAIFPLRMSDDNPSDIDVSENREIASTRGVQDISPISPSFAKDVLITELNGDSLSRMEINEYVLALGKLIKAHLLLMDQ